MPENQDEVLLILIISTGLILLLGTLVVIALLIQKKRRFLHRKQLSELQGHYEKVLLQTKLKILEDTFTAISRSLHDNIGSNISTAILLLYKDEQLDESEYESNRKESLAILDKVVDDLKNISHSLNPNYLDEIGLNEAIKHRVEQLTKTKKYKIDFLFNEAPYKLNRQKQLVLFYVFQEAINNINTHAGASVITVQLQYEPDQLNLQISDNGKGLTVGHLRKKGSGLINMKQHAETIAASLDIKSETGRGTIISLSVPDPYDNS